MGTNDTQEPRETRDDVSLSGGEDQLEKARDLEYLSDSEAEAWDATKLSQLRKLHIIIAGFTCTFNGNFGSSLPSGALDAISAHFGVTNRVHLILLNSLYMTGYVLGPVLFGPLSEYIGRRPVLIGTFLGYLVFTLACSVSPNFPAFLIFRVLTGINAAAPTTVIGGLYADILDDPSDRGNAMAVYMTVTTIGPLIGPIISGFSSTVSWRWPFWIAGMMAAAGLPLVLALPETYAPVLRNKYIKKRAKMNGRQQVSSPGTDQLVPTPFDVRKIFLRPITLLVTEPILLSTSAYLTLAYAVFYLMFQAYPFVFQDFYGLAPGPAALAYVPLAIGAILAMGVFSAFTWFHGRQTKAGAPWTKKEIYRRLPLACIAAPLMVIGLFWLGWTVWPTVPAIVPMISGVFFCCGYQLLFMGMVNYLTDVYRQYSASAHAAASMTRSIGAILLPLAADSMYSDLGLHWAPSVLGFVALAMGVIPFVFIRFGSRLARSSKAAREAFSVDEA